MIGMDMRSGQAARMLGVAVVTLRRWDKSGHLMPTWRTPGGHRRDSTDDLNAMAGRSAPNRRTVGYEGV